MKNSPENNFWNEVRDRLDSYAEEPTDDSWDKIAGAIGTKPQPRIIAWLERRVSSMQVSLAGFAFLVALAASDQSPNTWSKLFAETIVEQEETSSSTMPTGTEKIASAGVASDASVQSVQEDEVSSATTVEQERSSAIAAATTETSGTKVRAVQHVRKTNRKVAGKVKRTDGTPAQQKIGGDTDSDSAETPESGEGVRQDLNTKISADSDQASSVKVSPVVQSDEMQETMNSGDQVHANNPVASSAAISVDTIVQKDANKKKKEPVVAAKDKKEAEKKKAQLHIPMVYFQVGPSLAYHKITPSTDDNVTITELEESGIFASDRIGLSVEAGFQYRVAPRLEVYGGLSYYHQSQHIRYTVADASSGSVTGNAGDGYVFTPVITKHDVNYTMRNAGVSAGAFYRIKTHLLEHKFGVGLLYQQGFLRARGEGSAYTNNGSKYLQYQLQYRMEAGLNDRMRLYFQPGFTHAFHVDEKLNQPFTIKPYRAGISVGIVYLFK